MSDHLLSLVPFNEVIAGGPDDLEPAPGFMANLRGEDVEVTAVLERTAVVASLRDRWADKRVVPLIDMLVDPATIRWRPKTTSTGFPEKRRRRYTEEQRRVLRAASDRRARAERARKDEAEAAARRAAVPRQDAQAPRPGVRPTPLRPPAVQASRRAVPVSTLIRDRVADVPITAEVQQPARSFAAQLHDAHRRIAKLEAELERHRRIARALLERIELLTGRRAA